jgi:hypothetical protein
MPILLYLLKPLIIFHLFTVKTMRVLKARVVGRAPAARDEAHAEVGEDVGVEGGGEAARAAAVAPGGAGGEVAGAGDGEEHARDDDVQGAVGGAVVVEVLAQVDAAVHVGVAAREVDPAVLPRAVQGAPAVDDLHCVRGSGRVFGGDESVGDREKQLSDLLQIQPIADYQEASEQQGASCHHLRIASVCRVFCRDSTVVMPSIDDALAEVIKVRQCVWWHALGRCC